MDGSREEWNFAGTSHEEMDLAGASHEEMDLTGGSDEELGTLRNDWWEAHVDKS